jgi:hypothetical protein
VDPMTEQPEPESILAAILAEVQAMRSDLDDVRGEIADTREDLAHRADRIEAKVDQLRADVAAVKVDTAFCERGIRDHRSTIVRHLEDPDAHRRAA